MIGELHIKPVGYNCPCNLGRRTWRECADCERLRTGPVSFEPARTKGRMLLDAALWALGSAACGFVLLGAAIWWRHGY